MATRESKVAVLARFVHDLAGLSKCTDKKVAAIITNSDMTQVYSIGINGGPKGPSQIECLCKLGGKYTCLHAEINALAKCTSTDTDKIMICTMSPCVTCAAAIVNSGFNQVLYLDEYRDTTGLDILRSAGIWTERILLLM